MSIPLDRLYHYLRSQIKDDIIIYCWTPHGSKKLADLTSLTPFEMRDYFGLPGLIAHDQEPLDYELFEAQDYEKIRTPNWKNYQHYVDLATSIPNLKCRIEIWNVFEKALLCHSEKNSPELTKFDSHFVGVYYWSHALISRDWFRFAEHDCVLVNDPDHYHCDFLIYNRAWTGTREYRLKFSELLVEQDLLSSSLVKFSPTDSGCHYTQHRFKNPKFKISNFNLENSIPENNIDASASADYVAEDYNACGIEVVLETLFDDVRHHLTEKTLRPIACGKPFILLSSPGILQYLKDYGFQTFNGLIDESYDNIQDPLQRLECVIQEMQRISRLPAEKKSTLFHKLNEIAYFNKKLFFSSQWQQQIVDEFSHNFSLAFKELSQYKTAKMWKVARDILAQDTDLHAIVNARYKVDDFEIVNYYADQYSQSLDE